MILLKNKNFIFYLVVIDMAALSSFTSNTLAQKVTIANKLDIILELGSNITLKYSKLCYKRLTENDQIRCMYNILDDYIDILDTYLIDVSLTPEEVKKYKYNPKRMAYDLYGSTDLYSFILYINKYASVREFTLNDPNIKLIHVDNLASILSSILSIEEEFISEPIPS